jgi:hypothetical protein
VPAALAMMLVCCLEIDLRQRLVRNGFVALLSFMVIVRVAEIDVAWAQLTPETAEMKASVKRITRGSRVLIAYAYPTGASAVDDLGLVHSSCMAIIDRSALVTTAFTVKGKQIMHVTPAYRGQVDTQDSAPPTIAELVSASLAKGPGSPRYWSDWSDKFDYLYVLFTDPDAPNPAPGLLKRVYEGDRFRLYKIKRAKE